MNPTVTERFLKYVKIDTQSDASSPTCPSTEKQKDFDLNFDTLYEKYKKKALEAGYKGELKFIKEKGRVIIYIVI